MWEGGNKLWYKHPAGTWPEALPLGNGRIGAMVYGGAKEERFALNEDTLWSGVPGRYDNPVAIEAFKRARDAALARNYREASDTLEKDFLRGLWSQLYLPLGDITLRMAHGEPSSYKRELNLHTAVHSVSYMAGRVFYYRESFLSFPDQALVTRITSDTPGAVSFTVTLTGALKSEISVDGNDLLLTGHCPLCVHHMGKHQEEDTALVYGETSADQGVGYAARLRVICRGGRMEADENGVTVTGADSARLIFCVRTSYAGWNRHPVLEGKEYLEKCRADVDAASRQPYGQLKSRHTADYGGLYNRVELDLGGGEAGLLPTDERLLRHKEGLEDKALYTLLFNYGRYLTISASREGSQAMNLQGIWNDQVTPPWNCNYTININTEMNYWPTLPCNLPECMGPYLSLVSETAESGQWTAREYYGAHGAVAHHNTDLWRMTTPVGAGCDHTAVYGFWPMGLAWLSRGVWEYYAYTGDLNYLKASCYPILRQTAEFLLDMLTEDDDGTLIFAPATSPENTFIDPQDGKSCAVAAYTAMNSALIRDVFTHCLRAEKALGMTADEDTMAARLEFVLPRLKPFEIDEKGRIMEWSGSLEEAEPEHRHSSPLYGLHPGRCINERTPDLLEACRQTLLSRGDDGTGWSLAWKTCLWARLGDGSHALREIDLALLPADGENHHGGTFPNLMNAHPPFQIDGNFGLCAGIAEMLLQVDADGNERLLPALPKKWLSGTVRGLRTPSGHTVDIVWRDGRVVSSAFYPLGRKRNACSR